MHHISTLPGGAVGAEEDACREMLQRGLAWLDTHPEADPVFAGMPIFTESGDVFGVATEDHADALLLMHAIGGEREHARKIAMHCLFVRKHGWEKYCGEMTSAGPS
jgi:hypothetical protein